MEQTIFAQLSLVIVIAVAVSFVMRLLHQPLIMGYILTGVVVGPSFLHLINDKPAFESFSEIGIALLLFIIGLGLNAVVIRNLGKVVLLASMAEVLAVGAVGYLLGLGLGFSPIESAVIAMALIFSSTIIIVKVLNDKKENTRLYGQIAIGVLLVEDVLASIALLFVAAGKDGGMAPLELGSLVGKGILLAVGLIFFSAKILPRLAKLFADSQEFLFTFAIAWGFGIATLFEISGFSVEVGALFAGVSLASLPYAQEMGARLKPLRDFFVVLFFIVLGESLNFHDLAAGLVPALIFSAIVLVTKPLFIMATLGFLGYTKRISFKTGVHLSQISEFSIVLVVLAQASGMVSGQLSAIITLVAIITIAASTYLMKYDDQLYAKFEKGLKLFERRVVKDEVKDTSGYPLVLFGYSKGGPEFVKTFRDMRKKFVVVDYDPEMIERLEHQRIHYVYGDATDLELLQEIGIEKSRLIVSNINDYPTNISLVKHILHINPRAVIICHADELEDAVELYRHGAAYVMMPHYIGSEKISSFIKRNGLTRREFEHYKQKHLLILEAERAQD